MDGMWLVAGGTALLASLGYLESYYHRLNLCRIPIRIHVNGTRGKSGVTRLIAAGLRAGGIRTCAKTTGTLPRMIFPDGSEYPVFRPSRANVIEQLRIVRAAVAARAEALVIECMAVQPMLQSLCELQLVRATHGVITNARADHLDAMGPTGTDVARALAGTVPVKGKLFTTEQRYLEVLEMAVRDRQARMVAVGEEDISQLRAEEMSRFSYIEHPENVALALRVCADLGIERQTALEGMWRAQPDAGVLTAHQISESGHEMVFVNGFAANDPESTEHLWNMVLERFPQVEQRIAVFNCRADRPDRTVQLAEACVRWKPADHYMVIGTATNIFSRRATAMGLSPQRMTCAENCSGEELLRVISARSSRSTMIMGMGNISGPGMELVRYFQSRTSKRVAAELQEAA